MDPIMAPTGAKSLSAAPSLASVSVATGPSPLLEVLVGSVELLSESESESEPVPVPVLSAPDVVGVLLEPLPGIPLSKPVVSLSTALLVRVLPLPLPVPLPDALHAATSSSIWKARSGQKLAKHL